MIGGQQELLSGRLNYVSGMQIMYESTGIMSYGSGWVVGKQMVCITILKVCVDFVEVVLMFMMQMPLILPHGLIMMEWLFLKLFNAAFFNVRLL